MEACRIDHLQPLFCTGVEICFSPWPVQSWLGPQSSRGLVLPQCLLPCLLRTCFSFQSTPIPPTLPHPLSLLQFLQEGELVLEVSFVSGYFLSQLSEVCLVWGLLTVEWFQLLLGLWWWWQWWWHLGRGQLELLQPLLSRCW